MAEPNHTAWPTAIIAADDSDDAPEGRHVVLTALSMAELVRRLEPLGPRVAASVNSIQYEDRPLLALEVKAGTSVPELYQSVDGDDLTFIQGGLTWLPGEARLLGTSSVYILMHTLEAPQWLGATGYMVPPLTEHNTLFYVVVLPSAVDATTTLHLRVKSCDKGLEIPPEVVTHPPHPLLWWGTPPKGHGGRQRSKRTVKR